MPDRVLRTLTERNWSVLGLLRFILAFSIMTGHIEHAAGFHKWLWTCGGFSTVCGFFIISGFSIAASLQKNRGGYFKRRCLRIYPLVLADIAITLLVVLATGSGPAIDGYSKELPQVTETLSTCFLMNGLLVVTPSIFLPLWSLDCEIVYYLIAPFLARTSQGLAAVSGLVSLLVYVVPLMHGHLVDFSYGTHGTAVISLWWLWLLGFAAYHNTGKKWLIVLCVLSGCLVAPRATHEGPLALPLFIIVAVCVGALPHIALPARIVRFANYLGELSYPLYLMHLPVVFLVGAFLAGQPVKLIVPAVWLGSIALAMASYHGIDRQVRRARREGRTER